MLNGIENMYFNDDPNYKNSVISCWEISEKRLQNYLRNKTILYKKE